MLTFTQRLCMGSYRSDDAVNRISEFLDKSGQVLMSQIQPEISSEMLSKGLRKRFHAVREGPVKKHKTRLALMKTLIRLMIENGFLNMFETLPAEILERLAEETILLKSRPEMIITCG